ncbi:adenine phosphoribosyltransferase [Candidatus Bathyarchaeota archaeon]|nr:MAG: adenine phosphoribosyltransferase [Candidatus Bathyarchaeota archaeon]
MESRAVKLKYRMMVTELLKVASKKYKYQELKELLGLSPPILSRYTRGHVLPSYSRAQWLYERLLKIVNIKEELRKLLKFDEEGYFNNTPLVSDITWLKLMANYVVERFAGARVTKILTAAVDGIPISTMVASLLDVDLVIAKESREVGVDKFLEETYIPKGLAVRRTLYIPRTAIKPRDSVLIIDDVVRTGETLKALADMVLKMKARKKDKRAGPDLAGIFVIVSVGDEWKELLEEIAGVCPIETLIQV